MVHERHTIALQGNVYAHAVLFTPDGRDLLAVDDSGKVRRFRVATGEEVDAFDAHPRTSVLSFSLSADGKLLATGGIDRTAKVWDADTGQLLTTCAGHAGFVKVALSPDGKLLATGSNQVQLWDPATGRPLGAPFAVRQGFIETVVIAPDGKTLAYAVHNIVKVWDLAAGRESATLRGHTDTVVGLAFSRDSKTLASASVDRTVRFWDPATGAPRRTLRGHTVSVSSVAFSPDGSLLVSGAGATRIKPGRPGEVELWDVATGRLLADLKGHGDGVSCVAFSPDGRTVASVCHDATIKLWDVSGFGGKPVAAAPVPASPLPRPTAAPPVALVPTAPRTIRAGTDTATLARQARDILTTYCYRCHGKDGTAEGGFNFALEPRRLLARKLIVPGRPAASRLVLRVQRGEMPPPEEASLPSPQEVAVLARWVRAGAPDFNPARVRRPRVTPLDVVQTIHDDLARLEGPERPFARYFTFTHLANAGLSEDELQTCRHALSKLVNSLSRRPKITVPRAVDRAGTIFRIDLRDYPWRSRQWESVVAAYPYGGEEGEAAEFCRTVTRSTQPLVRGDWFIHAAWRPPLYYQLVDMEESFGKIWQVEGPGWTGNKNQHAPLPEARAGFTSSGVARNYRIIERWDTPHGYLWRTFDFAGNAGQRNFFAHPLHFRHDGSEALFSLPNGLQAYAILNADDNREDKGPIDLVSDPRRPDRRVVVGISCMACHARGIIEKADQVRAQVDKNPQAFFGGANLIHEKYPPAAQFRDFLRKDAQRFQTAVRQTGAPLNRTEPIAVVALRYEGDLDLDEAVAEAGLAPEAYVRRCRASGDLIRKLGPLLDRGTVPRDAFLDALPLLTRSAKASAALPGRDGHELGPFHVYLQGMIDSIAFTPDGRHAVSAARFKTIQVWDLATGKELRSFNVPGEGRLAVLPDGRHFLNASDGGSGLRLYDLATGAEVRCFCTDAVDRPVLSPDGRRVLATDAEGFRLWDVATGRELRRFRGEAKPCHAVVFSPDGRQAASASGTVVRLWDVETGRQVGALKGHTAPVLGMAFAPDGKQLLSSGEDGTLRLWDIRTGREVRRLGEKMHALATDVAFLPGGKRALSANELSLRLWDVATGAEVRPALVDDAAHRDLVTAFVVSPDGRYVLSAGLDRWLILWKLPRSGAD